MHNWDHELIKKYTKPMYSQFGLSDGEIAFQDAVMQLVVSLKRLENQGLGHCRAKRQHEVIRYAIDDLLGYGLRANFWKTWNDSVRRLDWKIEDIRRLVMDIHWAQCTNSEQFLKDPRWQKFSAFMRDLEAFKFTTGKFPTEFPEWFHYGLGHRPEHRREEYKIPLVKVLKILTTPESFLSDWHGGELPPVASPGPDARRILYLRAESLQGKIWAQLNDMKLLQENSDGSETWRLA